MNEQMKTLTRGENRCMRWCCSWDACVVEEPERCRSDTRTDTRQQTRTHAQCSALSHCVCVCVCVCVSVCLCGPSPAIAHNGRMRGLYLILAHKRFLNLNVHSSALELAHTLQKRLYTYTHTHTTHTRTHTHAHARTHARRGTKQSRWNRTKARTHKQSGQQKASQRT